jgi:hypothetical protein
LSASRKKSGGGRPAHSKPELYDLPLMSEDAKIYVDANRPATLHNGAVSTDWPTLRDAVMAWHRLRPEQARSASIRVIGGMLYTAAEITKLHYGSKPPSG